ncbi:MAG TPA: class I SAM-dependent methyltransferase [Candidatus Aminicenantes bacterium]|nr:class I SAM-dependent methyltransferase [Candidatus Aminicenantes bacterium]
MPEHGEIYARHAAEYERLVACEDYRQRILPELNRIVPFTGRDVVELGAGTGRLTRQLVPMVRSILACDGSPAMLAVAEAKLKETGLTNWRLAVADHRRVDEESGRADVALAGWSVCYLKDWGPPEWEPEVERALAEMDRLVRRGGHLILLETLGTGNETPEIPDNLAPYFALLERQGFRRNWIRTDYRFRDLAEARELAGFFFGERILDKLVEADGAVFLPECTGLWWRRVT